MPVTALVREPALATDWHAETDALQALVSSCVEWLARVAHENGERQRASQLLEAAALLRDAEPGSASAVPAQLTPREWEVARLIALGRSNRQIAEALVVSERTVDTHVSHILRKLCQGTRAQVAAWVVQRTAPGLRAV